MRSILRNFPRHQLPSPKSSSSLATKHQPDLNTYIHILTTKVSKHTTHQQILHSLLTDPFCHRIPLSHSLIHTLLSRFKDNPKSAFAIFNWASSRQTFSLSPHSYDLMIDIFGRTKSIDNLTLLLDEMRRARLVTLNTVAKVMRRFAGAGLWPEAVRIFHDLETFGLEKNAESMNLLLDSLCKEKFVEQAREVFLELKKCIAPDARTFNIFIHGWCKVNRVDEAHWTIQEMKGYGFLPCVISYSTIIRCYCREQNFESVYEVLDEMRKRGCAPNVVTYTTIMCELAKAGKFEEAFEVKERMRVDGCKPDTPFFNWLIYVLGRAGRIDDATRVFEVEMPESGVVPNVSTYNSMISMFCFHGYEKRAFAILKEMEDSGLCMPDVQTYHPLIKSCFRTGNIDSWLNDVLDDMVNKHHIGLDLSTYTLLIHGLCRADRCERAFSLFKEMIDQDIIPRYRTCRLLLDEVKQKNMFEAAEKIEELMKKL